MAQHSLECRVCGCRLDHADVRQLALYYLQEQPSVIAVQFVCPRCSAAEWQHYDPAEWGENPLGLPADWPQVTDDVEVCIHSGEEAAPGACEGDWEFDLQQPIGMDEYIEFARQLERTEVIHLGSVGGRDERF